MSDEQELRDFVSGATAAMGIRFGEDAEPLELEADAADPVTESAPQEDQAVFDRWVDTLTVGERQRAADDVEWRDYQYGLWQTRDSARTADFDRDGSEPVDDLPAPTTVAEIADWAAEHAAEIRRWKTSAASPTPGRSPPRSGGTRGCRRRLTSR